jgi:hypothetical protein
MSKRVSVDADTLTRYVQVIALNCDRSASMPCAYGYKRSGICIAANRAIGGCCRRLRAALDIQPVEDKEEDPRVAILNDAKKGELP